MEKPGGRHRLCKSSDESSKAMEAQGAVDMWNWSVENSGRYVNFVGDGDCFSHRDVVKVKPYRDEVIVRKVECVSHIQKRMGGRLSMESQMVQNSRNKIGLTFNKFVIKVKTDLSQVQQNQFTFNRFSVKVKAFRIKLNKITSSLSRNYLSRARDI